MTDIPAVGLNLAHVIARFPENAPLIRRLVLADQAFRSVCEDYALARETLTRFEALPEAEKKPAEVADYVSVIAALEDEIAADLRNARRFAGET
nr:hypothetical protein [uncultured Rhodopila sp.]